MTEQELPGSELGDGKSIPGNCQLTYWEYHRAETRENRTAQKCRPAYPSSGQDNPFPAATSPVPPNQGWFSGYRQERRHPGTNHGQRPFYLNVNTCIKLGTGIGRAINWAGAQVASALPGHLPKAVMRNLNRHFSESCY